MNGSTKSFFPDINVWIALAYGGHQHHEIAAAWFASVTSGTICFCRFTQLGLLRLLTQPSVMREDVRQQRQAWEVYDELAGDDRVVFKTEVDPEQIESHLRRLTRGLHPAAAQWPDAYLAAFAHAADLTPVTFDRGLHRMAPGSLLLAR